MQPTEQEFAELFRASWARLYRLALAVSGIALATLTPEQLAALRPPKRKRPDEPEASEPESKPAAAHAPVSGARRYQR